MASDHRYGDVAVFYRTNAQSRVLEESLVRSGVPYRVFGGVKFYDRREIKDALAYLRALVNPDDEVSWKRIVNTPRRGVGDTSVAKIDSYAERRRRSVPPAIADAAAAGVSGKALGGLRDLLDLMSEAADAAAGGVGAALEAVLTRSGYLAELEAERSIEAAGRIENLQELVGRRASSTSRSIAATSAVWSRSAASASARARRRAAITPKDWRASRRSSRRSRS